MTKLSKLQQWTIDGLNEYAFADARGELMAGHSPASPMYWFAGLARETAKVRMRRLGIEVAR